MKFPSLGMIKTSTLQALLFPRLLLLRRRGRKPLPRIDSLQGVVIVDPEGGIGDAVLLTALLWELSRQCPRARVTLLLRPIACQVLEGSGLAADIRPVRLGKGPLERIAFAFGAAIGTWRQRFNVAIVTKWDTDYFEGPLIAALTRSRYVVGYSEKVAGKDRANWHYDNYLSHPLVGPGSIHEVEKKLKLLELFGGVARPGALYLKGDPLPAEVDRLLDGQRDGHGERPYVALGIGASVAIRRWPVERFAEIARRLVSAGCRPMLVGGREDEESARMIVEACGADNAIDLVGRLTIRQFCEALRRCACFVGNDSGPMHLAASAGIPVVEISLFPRDGDIERPTSITRFRPWGVDVEIVRPDRPLAPCPEACKAEGAHCITQISIDEVWGAVKKTVARVRAGSASQCAASP